MIQLFTQETGQTIRNIGIFILLLWLLATIINFVTPMPNNPGFTSVTIMEYWWDLTFAGWFGFALVLVGTAVPHGGIVPTVRIWLDRDETA
ncbi:hypothetical protein HY933_00920 [Candidatus Falkowbacteria bacterium]|nr:hypothetical protein [Candidatus Falkowbacteria bacterium]